MIAIYAILMLNVMGSLLDTGRESLEYICTTTAVSVPNPGQNEKTKERKEPAKKKDE